MKITFKRDRVRLQSENARESKAILAIHDLMWFATEATAKTENIANDHGCIVQKDLTALNYCSIPLAKKINRGKRA
jgi:hypothetical protein